MTGQRPEDAISPATQVQFNGPLEEVPTGVTPIAEVKSEETSQPQQGSYQSRLGQSTQAASQFYQQYNPGQYAAAPKQTLPANSKEQAFQDVLAAAKAAAAIHEEK
jgi:hypothetical protein